MTVDAQEFYEKYNIDISTFNIDDIDPVHRIRSSYSINPITDTVALYENQTKETISIADIIGYDKIGHKDYYVLESISSFFDRNGDSYHNRSVGLLEYGPNEIISKLSNSFIIEPIVTKELDNNKYIISTNGLHRYTVLRSLYLIEYEKNKKNPQKLEELKTKYQIPVRNNKLDYFKTYSAYLILLSGVQAYFRNEYDENYNFTNRTEYINKNTKEKKYLTNEELLELTINSIQDNEKITRTIINNCILLPSFYEYAKKYLSSIIDLTPVEQTYIENYEDDKEAGRKLKEEGETWTW